MEENKKQVEVREEYEIKRYNVFITIIAVIVFIGIKAYFSNRVLSQVPVIGGFLSILMIFIVILFSFLYAIRRYAFLLLMLLILALLSGGIIPIIALVIGLAALFYSARYFVLCQFPFSLFTEAYLKSQEKKVQAECFEFEKQQREYARRS